MRILHIGQHFEDVGGAEVLRARLVNALESRGHVNAFFGGDRERERNEPELRTVLRPDYEPRTLVEEPRLVAAFDDFVARFEPDVIHLHQMGNLPLELYDHLGAAGVPVVQSVYDYGLFCPNSWAVLNDGRPCTQGPGAVCLREACHENYPFSPVSALVAHNRLRRLREVSDGFVAATRHLVQQLERHDCRNAVQVPYFHDGPRLATSDSERVPGRVLTIARLVPEKGIAQLLESLRFLRRRRSDAHLVVIGDGPLRADLERQARELGLADAVEFKGKLATGALGVELARAMVMAIPSIWAEALPLVCQDAFAAGTPIVASDLGGLPEAVRPGVNGYLANPRSASDFAAALGRVLAGGEVWEQLSVGSRESFEVGSEQRYVDAIERVYTRAMDRRRERTVEFKPMPEGERRLLEQAVEHWANREQGVSRTRLPKLVAGLEGRVSHGLMKNRVERHLGRSNREAS
jgi:glycosyltransferase involved in cell wall biosynthesis